MRAPLRYQTLVLLLTALLLTAGLPVVAQTADAVPTKSATAAGTTAGDTTKKTDDATGKPTAEQPSTGKPSGEKPRDGGAPPTRAGDTGGEQPVVPLDAIPDQPVDPDKVQVSVAFTKAEISNVLSFLSMASGVPIVIDADVKGQVTITSMKKVSLPVACEVINSALRVRGYTMVGTLKDKLIRVVTLKKAVSDKANVQIGSDPGALGTGDNMITQVVPLQFASAAKLKDELKPLVSDDQANILAISSTNMLVVTDTEGNVKRLLQIVNLLDKDTSDIVDVSIYPCKSASAEVLIQSLDKIFATSTTPIPGQPQPQPQPGQPSISTDSGVLSLRGVLRFAVDQRTNSIIISASKAKTAMVLDLIKKLDIDTTPEVRAHVFTLKYADAKLVSDQLNKLFEQPEGSPKSPIYGMQYVMPGMPKSYAGMKRNIVVPDVRTNSVIITATDQNMRSYETMIGQLDAPSALSDITRTFQLRYAKAKTLETTLNTLFRGNNGQRLNWWDVFNNNNSNQDGDPINSLKSITVVAEEKTNTLLITGPPQSFSMVENIIKSLDRRTVQVFIEVAIVDVTLNKATKFGIEWNWAQTSADGKHNSVVKTDFGVKSDTTQGLKYSVVSNNLQALLHTLSTRSDVNVYSTPSITTADNVQAKISIGTDEPFVSSSTTNSVGDVQRSVDYKNVSIALTVTPHVNEPSRLIALDVEQTINELLGREPVLNAPIVASRNAKTTVMVTDGQTIVIGGIIKENKVRTVNGVPVISRIPYLGELFKTHETTAQKSELMVFITPHILQDEESIKKVTDEAHEKIDDLTPPVKPQPEKAP